MRRPCDPNEHQRTEHASTPVSVGFPFTISIQLRARRPKTVARAVIAEGPCHQTDKPTARNLKILDIVHDTFLGDVGKRLFSTDAIAFVQREVTEVQPRVASAPSSRNLFNCSAKAGDLRD